MDIVFFVSKICFGIGNVILISKLIDGIFLDYSCVILIGNDKLFKIDLCSFEEGVDCVVIIVIEKICVVKMVLDCDKIILFVISLENGIVVEEVFGDYDGESFEIGFNVCYLFDIF